MKIAVEVLRNFMEKAAETLTGSADQAKIMVDNLITANQWGVDSHGVGRYPVYMGRLKKNLVKRNPEIKMVSRTPATLCVDGDNGLGSVITIKTIDRLMELADIYGIAMAEIMNSNHYGAAGYYCNYACEKGYALLTCTVGPANMPPFGGAEAYFSTNPFAVGMPRTKRPHIIVDMATANAAKGKIREAARKGQQIPIGWAIDKFGNPTTDPNAAIEGLVLPMAGHKGSGIALSIEYLAGVLSGGGIGTEVTMQYGDDPTPANVGHSVVVFKPEAFLNAEEYEKRVEKLCSDLHAIKPATGFERVILPGEIELASENKINCEGIEIDDKLYAQFKEIADYTGISANF
jgi:LDH2 family malate/lactate/ureidoglycolate dehydrogenase